MQETIAYRLNFVMWRLRGVLQLLVLYYLWLSLLPENATLFGYTQSLILTYILMATVFGAVISSTRLGGLGEEINNGNLSNLLIRPVHYFYVWIATDLGDKIMNISFSAVEVTLLVLLLHPPLFIQTNIFILLGTAASILLATALYFIISMLLGTVGFWSNETWAPRFIFTILLQFFSGSVFPLDILPTSIYNFFIATPFPYLLYFPLKLYLGQLSPIQVMQTLIISGIWVLISFLLLQKVWAKGLRLYTAQGR